MLNLDKGTVHLSYEQGAGATTLLLTIVRQVLESGNRVIWLGRYLPDGERSNHILGSLNGEQLQKFFIIQLEEDIDSVFRILKIIINKNIFSVHRVSFFFYKKNIFNIKVMYHSKFFKNINFNHNFFKNEKFP